MGLLLKQIFGLVKLLNSDKGTNQIASGIAAGFILGMTPAFSLQTVLVWICLFFFRIQIGAAFLSAFFFAFAAYLLSPVFHMVGSSVLQMGALEPMFTSMYNLPIIPFTRFNNTIVMGSGLVSILLAPLVYLLAKNLVINYRETVVKKFKETKFWKFVKATSFYKWYLKYDELY